jgi:hypothetical protein
VEKLKVSGWGRGRNERGMADERDKEGKGTAREGYKLEGREGGKGGIGEGKGRNDGQRNAVDGRQRDGHRGMDRERNDTHETNKNQMSVNKLTFGANLVTCVRDNFGRLTLI